MAENDESVTVEKTVTLEKTVTIEKAPEAPTQTEEVTLADGGETDSSGGVFPDPTDPSLGGVFPPSAVP